MNRHMILLRRIEEAIEDVSMHSETNQHAFDLYFDIEKMTEIAEFLEGFDAAILDEIRV